MSSGGPGGYRQYVAILLCFSLGLTFLYSHFQVVIGPQSRLSAKIDNIRDDVGRLEDDKRQETEEKDNIGLLKSYVDHREKSKESAKLVNDVVGNISGSDDDDKQNRKIWASMGLCYNKRAQFNGKEKYPYKEVTPLALLLWKYFVPEVRTIVRIVYTDDELTSEMLSFSSMLESTGALVEWVKSGDMDCVLKSQLIRIVAFEHPAVDDRDILVTVDCNLFVMSKDILEPLDQFPDMVAWVFQWGSSAWSASKTGETFNQNLIAMRAGTWRNITRYNGDLQSLVERYKTLLGWSPNDGTWYTDQYITTYSLLHSKICSVPANNGLWSLPGLVHDKTLDDSKTCWHGGGLRNKYIDCNIGRSWLFLQSCKWWHFYPMEGLARHIHKFYELTHHTVSLKKFASLYEGLIRITKVKNEEKKT